MICRHVPFAWTGAPKGDKIRRAPPCTGGGLGLEPALSGGGDNVARDQRRTAPQPAGARENSRRRRFGEPRRRRARCAAAAGVKPFEIQI